MELSRRTLLLTLATAPSAVGQVGPIPLTSDDKRKVADALGVLHGLTPKLPPGVETPAYKVGLFSLDVAVVPPGSTLLVGRGRELRQLMAVDPIRGALVVNVPALRDAPPPRLVGALARAVVALTEFQRERAQFFLRYRGNVTRLLSRPDLWDANLSQPQLRTIVRGALTVPVRAEAEQYLFDREIRRVQAGTFTPPLKPAQFLGMLATQTPGWDRLEAAAYLFMADKERQGQSVAQWRQDFTLQLAEAGLSPRGKDCLKAIASHEGIDVSDAAAWKKWFANLFAP